MDFNRVVALKQALQIAKLIFRTPFDQQHLYLRFPHAPLPLEPIIVGADLIGEHIGFHDEFKIADFLGPSRAHNAAPPPSGALLVGRDGLPPRLRHLDSGAQAISQKSGPIIVYPQDGALIEWRGEDLPLEATGGKKPLRWLVDGRPLTPAAPSRGIYWQPEGIGFVQLSVIDAAGRSAHSTVRLSR